MEYVSTRGKAPVLGFEEAMLAGLARDGGLYVPRAWPRLAPDAIAAMAGQPYAEVACRVMRPFVGDAFADAEFRAIVEDTYACFGHRAVAPLVQTGPEDWLLELFHGPTLAFKDVAMQLIGRLFEASLTRRGERITIVGATSGDTGSAAIEAFRGRAAADVFILYPHGRISEVQRRQMTTPVESNVHALAVEGDFDDCQALVKAMFNDFAFRDAMRLGAVNSINWSRILAQIVYYFTAAVALGAPARRVSFSVPTGNFGDVFAGYVARAMGLPIDRLLVATNENDILHRTLTSGAYARGEVTPTLSPSMDIQVSSNFERLLFDVYDREGGAVAELMAGFERDRALSLDQGRLSRLRESFDSARIDTEATLATMRRMRESTGQVLDPHTAIGVAAAESAARTPGVPMVTLATAHPAKFPDAATRAGGAPAALPPRMADLFDRPERVTVLPADLAAIEAHITAHTGALA